MLLTGNAFRHNNNSEELIQNIYNSVGDRFKDGLEHKGHKF